MIVSKLIIKNFRGIRSAELFLPKHSVLIGDNNCGKSTVIEALDLTLGPDRVSRKPVIDEHDFYNGNYLPDEKGKAQLEIFIEATVTELSIEQQSHFKDFIEWWDSEKMNLHTEPPPNTIDDDKYKAALRVCFIGRYDIEEDDFEGATYYSRSFTESEKPISFSKKDKQRCGFLYLRTLRTGSRALSLEKGSLLDIILRINDKRPQMWEKTISDISQFDVAADPELGISGILRSIEKAINKFAPKEWVINPHMKVSNLTREHLRKIITAFIATGSGNHSAPFYRQGTGTINILVLAMLSQIAEEKQNVIFAMEEPEIAIPPYTQKQIIHQIKLLSSQALFTSHSPYVIEEFSINETIVLTRDNKGVLSQADIILPDGLKLRRYRQDFRTRFCEGLISSKILIAEGATEAMAIPAVARRLTELNPNRYDSLEVMGFCTIDAEGESNIVGIAELYKNLGKIVFAVCDKQSQENEAKIAGKVEKLFMHEEKGFEALVLKNTSEKALLRFIEIIEWPDHLKILYPNPKNQAKDAIMEYFKWSKGNWGVAEFLSQCMEDEIPEWIKDTCLALKNL